MNNEGFWGNYRTGNIFQIDEHEQWIRRGNNASKLGVSIAVQKRFKDFIVREDRNPFLLFIFANSPVMRFRGHGSDVTMEFACSDWELPLELVRMWGNTNAGALLGLNIVNFGTNEAIATTWENFQSEKLVHVKFTGFII